MRKAVVILFPAYILCCMFEVLDPPRPMIENAWDALMLALGNGPRVFSAAELKAKGVGSRPMLRFVVIVVVVAVVAVVVIVVVGVAISLLFAREYCSSPSLAQARNRRPKYSAKQSSRQNNTPSFSRTHRRDAPHGHTTAPATGVYLRAVCLPRN